MMGRNIPEWNKIRSRGRIENRRFYNYTYIKGYFKEVTDKISVGFRRSRNYKLWFLQFFGSFISWLKDFSRSIQICHRKNSFFFRFSPFFPVNESREKTFSPDVNNPITGNSLNHFTNNKIPFTVWTFLKQKSAVPIGVYEIWKSKRDWYACGRIR